MWLALILHLTGKEGGTSFLDQSYINVKTKPIWFWVTSVTPVTQYMLLDPYCIIPVIMQFQWIGLDCTFITFVITVLYIGWNLQCFSFLPSCILKHLCFPLIKKSLPFLWISWKFYLRCSWSFLKEIVLIKKEQTNTLDCPDWLSWQNHSLH